MENKKGPGSLTGAMAGKGFYIVLFLCAAVIVAAAWIMAAGTDVEDTESAEQAVDISDAVVTMVPAGTPMEADEAVAAVSLQEPEAESTENETPEEDAAAVFSATETPYVWPVRGTVEVPYAVETLRYDPTMADWRTHNGIDIACAMGEPIMAAAGGTVVSVMNDDLFGTTIEIDHNNGIHSVYANLAEEPTVSVGEWVTMGQVIGSVGGTALAETNVVPHLHLAMTRDGRPIDPTELLPALS